MTERAPHFFSIIIATYNAEATIARCIESVLTQTESSQVIVVDGLSQDQTVNILNKYHSERLVIISEKDQGVYDAWNKGILKTTGEWIIFLGADDFYKDQNSLKYLRQGLEAAPIDCCLAYGLVEVEDRNGNIIAVENEPWEKCGKTLTKNMPYTHVGSAHRKTLFEKRSFDPNFKIAGDYNFLYPILKKTTPNFIPSYVSQMKTGGLSTNSKNRIRLIKELKKIRKTHKIHTNLLDSTWTNLKLAYYHIRAFWK